MLSITNFYHSPNVSMILNIYDTWYLVFRTMLFDIFLVKYVGKSGCLQIWIVLTLLAGELFSSWHVFCPIYISVTPSFSCNQGLNAIMLRKCELARSATPTRQSDGRVHDDFTFCTSGSVDRDNWGSCWEYTLTNLSMNFEELGEGICNETSNSSLVQATPCETLLYDPHGRSSIVTEVSTLWPYDSCF